MNLNRYGYNLLLQMQQKVVRWDSVKSERPCKSEDSFCSSCSAWVLLHGSGTPWLNRRGSNVAAGSTSLETLLP